MKRNYFIQAFTNTLNNTLERKCKEHKFSKKYVTPSLNECGKDLLHAMIKHGINDNDEIPEESLASISAVFNQAIDISHENKQIIGKTAYWAKKAFKKTIAETITNKNSIKSSYTPWWETNHLDQSNNNSSKEDKLPWWKVNHPDQSNNNSSENFARIPLHFRDKNSLIPIFQQTKQIAATNTHGLDAQITQYMVANTCSYRSSQHNNDLINLATGQRILQPSTQNSRSNTQEIQTTYQLINQDSFVAAKQLIDQGFNPLVLNMANKTTIGGGVESGSKAQEECLFRCSNYHESLYPLGRQGNQGRWKYNNPIEEFGSHYTPDVQVFRDSTNNYAFISPFKVSCIAIAGYNLGGGSAQLENNLKDNTGQPLTGIELEKAFKKFTKAKIRHCLEVALHHKHDSLVLGAISCGAFKLPNDTTGITADLVANAYKEVLQESNYKNKFKHITFAVLASDKTGQENYNAFDSSLIKKLNKKSHQKG